MISFRLVSEYLAYPIFCSDLDKMGHVAIDDLPITEYLKSDLRAWDEAFQSTFNDAYPPDSRFESHELQEAHWRQGEELLKRLQDELGDGYRIEYQR